MTFVVQASVVLVVAVAAACGRQPAPAPAARNLLLVTIDTLRADRVGAYGLAAAHTPALDALARDGARFDRAYAPAPLTLPSHASLLTGLYPPGHGSRDNGIGINGTVPTLATRLHDAGFQTAAFVSAFPLDRRFGLARGFDVYDDRMPRGPDGAPENERPGRDTVRAARAWLDAHRAGRFFLWVHLFEPHAPYAPPGAGPALASAPPIARYDAEIAVADTLTGEIVSALGDAAPTTLVVVAGDHGEAFGEHGEVAHSIFVYDTTLRVPLLVRGPGVAAGRVVADPVDLVDVAPTVLQRLGVAALDADGVTLSPALAGAALAPRALYAESFAPLVDFGWSPLRSMRDGRWKYIAAPRPELYDVVADPGETRNLAGQRPQEARDLAARVDRISGPELPAAAAADPEAASRLRALGYVGGGRAGAGGGPRPDPKDRIAVAARLAEVTSGEATGREAIRLLEQVLADDPRNPQAHLRLGYLRLDDGDCARATPHFDAAIASGLPSADPYLGLARCQVTAGRASAAATTLRQALAVEPGNAVVEANLGLLALDGNAVGLAAQYLRQAVDHDPDLLEARFALARALARLGRRQEAAAEARELLGRLPAGAPQRPEVERLLSVLR